MIYSLDSLKAVFIGDSIGEYYRFMKGETWRLDYGSKDEKCTCLNEMGLGFGVYWAPWASQPKALSR